MFLMEMFRRGDDWDVADMVGGNNVWWVAHQPQTNWPQTRLWSNFD